HFYITQSQCRFSAITFVPTSILKLCQMPKFSESSKKGGSESRHTEVGRRLITYILIGQAIGNAHSYFLH
ncbi:MAG: hypothetical protein K1X32_11615, partial [Saprospiraceae bacterium]|nr:hypothetical protein [Saprospiraceae bacterium]